MKKIIWCPLSFLLFWTLGIPFAFSLPAEDIQVVTNTQYFGIAQKMIRESKESVYVIMFEMGYYDNHPASPSNLLVRELIAARKRGVRIEVILDVGAGEDRTTEQNRHTGKILSEGGIRVIYDPLSKTTHAKLMIVDRKLSLVGSTNWSYYALTDNNEVNVLIRSKEVAREMIDYFNRVKSTGSK